jgi:NTE family protein
MLAVSTGSSKVMTRALVLGGGGPVGVAWQSGLIAGFAQAGVDLAEADFILGTSAGSVVGARLATGAASARLADALLAEPPASGTTAAPAADLSPLMTLLAQAQSGTRNPAEARRDLGRLALAAETTSEAHFLKIIGRSLGETPHTGWPARDYACTAVDAEDGGFQLWQGGSGVDLLPAVASSCSVPGVFPPVALQGRRYMDGGTRSLTNADLAAGHDLVVVVAVQPPGAPDWMARVLAEEVESLQSAGATVVAITPDEGAAAAFGPNLMDFSRSAEVARSGLAQAASQAAILKSLWE